jgi:predicted metal-dependent hydrolase
MKRETVEKVQKMRDAVKQGGLRSVGAEDDWSCDEIPPPLFYEGLELFNRGEYFEQHEALEEIWIDDQRPLRRLYQGILKIGVGFYKLRLGNYRGTVNHIKGGIAYLERFEDGCLGVETARLIREAREVLEKVEELGTERMREFDLGTLPKVHYERRVSS